MCKSQGVGIAVMTSRHHHIITSWPAPILSWCHSKDSQSWISSSRDGKPINSSCLKGHDPPTNPYRSWIRSHGKLTHTLTQSHICTLKCRPAWTHRAGGDWYQSWAHRLVLIVYIYWFFKHSAWSPADTHKINQIWLSDLEKIQTLTL